MINDRKCMQRRCIRECKNCCRFNDCKNGVKTLFENVRGCEALGYDIIIAHVENFKKAWRCGHKSAIEFYISYFNSETPSIITGAKVNGVFVLEGLIKSCTEDYGSLESCYTKLEKKVKAKIAELEEKRKNAKSRQQKFELTNKINEVKGELNY